VKPAAIEGLNQVPITPSGFEPATCWPPV